jgi:CheY-like chemotaxis protein
MRWLKLQEVTPVISDITDHFRDTCQTEINHTLGTLDEVSEKTREDMEWLAHRISKKLSLAPIDCLKRRCVDGEVDIYSAVARELFGLRPQENRARSQEGRQVAVMNGKRKVLVVDDDADFAEATKAVLENADFEVAVAHSGEECLNEVERDKPDAIVVDVMMERMSTGFVLSRKLKKDDNYRRIPILMLTGVTKKTGFRFDPVTDGQEWLPVDDYAEKPLDPTDLVRRIEKLLVHE